MRQLEYVVAVADHGSFRAAAAACAVTQPGLSLQVRQLESALGTVLFERSKPVALTAAGQALVSRARALLADARALEEAARGWGKPFSGRLRLGVIPTVAPYLLPTAIPKIRSAYSDISIEIVEAQTESLVAEIQAGRLDVLLLALEAGLQGLETEPVTSDAFSVVLPETHPLSSRKWLRESDLEQEDLLLLSDGHCLRDQVLSVCRWARESGEREAFRATSLPTLVQMVASGVGITLLPEISLAREGRTRGVMIVPFVRPVPHRTLGLAWRPTSVWADEYRRLAKTLGRGR